jgi:chromosome segregation ATPase
MNFNKLSVNEESSSAESDTLWISKENLDALETELVNSTENFIKNRKLELRKIQNLQSQIQTMQDRLSHQETLAAQMEIKTKEYTSMIEKLENKLTEKQMAFDQLLEDLSYHQSRSQDETDKLKMNLAEEKGKFDQLFHEHTHIRETLSGAEIKLQEKIQSLEMENKDLKSRFQELQREKKHLIDTFNEFTARLTTPLVGTQDTEA